MAGLATARPTGFPAKPKRPIPPTLHTTSNGTHSTSSPSPSLASKRPPGSQGPTSAGSGLANGNITPNGTGPRVVRRKDSTKPGDTTGKPRIGRPPLETANSTTRPVKRVNEPFVKTEAWILRKYKKQPPSLILHLHPQYFRFDQQDGSFSYTSPMRVLLEHIKNQTVPAELLEELHAAGIKFYESCLIVQIHDHRNSTNSTSSTTNATKNDRDQPFSIHNWNQYITPSPHVPYPKNEEPNKSEESTDKAKQAESKNGVTQEPKIFTTVLFPTAMTLQDDLLRLALPLKQKQAKDGPPPAKKLKPSMSKKALETLEAEAILATAPPLFLEPVRNLTEMKQLYEKLADPLCNRLPPAPKSRKRTIAELAADEALAAEQQSFMLIMDERLAPNITATTTSKAIVAEAEANSGATEARFERFKLLAQLRLDIAEAKIRKDEQRMQAVQEQMAAQQQAQQQAAQLRAKMEQEAKTREMHLKQQQEAQRNKGMHQVAQPQQGSPMPTNPILAQQIAASQGAHSSPVVRHMSPQNAPSPAMGMLNRPQAVPMAVSSSGQGSPPRPGSAIPNGHPMVPQRSTQPPSRNGTPAMANGTPRLQQGTPVMRNVTPTPRMTQASPIVHPPATPMMANGMMGVNMNGQQATPTQQQYFLMQQQQQRQAAMAQQQHQQQQQQAAMMENIRAQRMGHQGPPMTPQQMQALAQAQAQARTQQAQDVYRANMVAMQQQMQNAAARPVNGMMGTPMQQTASQGAQSDIQRQMTAICNKIFADRIGQLVAQHGGRERIPPQEIQAAKAAATSQATIIWRRRQQNVQQQMMAQQSQQQQMEVQRRAAMMAHMQQSGQMNGQMNGMGGMGGM